MSSPSLPLLLQSLPGRELVFASGAAVFHLGDPVQLVHLVRSGVVHLIRHHDDGSPLIVQRAAAGAVLAEASVHSQRYHCDARAEIATVTWAVARRDLHRSLAENPEFGLAWARHLAHEVQSARLQAEILSLKTVAGRLSAWIAWHGPLPGKGRWSAISAEIGVSPEALYREIARRRR